MYMCIYIMYEELDMEFYMYIHMCAYLYIYRYVHVNVRIIVMYIGSEGRRYSKNRSPQTLFKCSDSDSASILAHPFFCSWPIAAARESCCLQFRLKQQQSPSNKHFNLHINSRHEQGGRKRRDRIHQA